MKSKSGFTIIEFIALLMLISALALVVSPKAARLLHSGQLEQTRHELKQAIRRTQQKAITENRSCRLLWNIASNRYEIYYYNGSAYTLSEQESLPQLVTLVSTTFTSNQVDFDNYGSPSAAGTVTLLDSAGVSKQISVAAGSGIVSLP